MSFQPSRREVLKGGAAAAAALGMADFGSVLKNALAAPACGSLADVEHVVIFIQENRPFDQYFGRYKGVRGFDDRTVRLSPLDDGTAVFKQPSPAQDAKGVAVPGPHPLPPFKLDTSAPGPRQGDCTNDVDHQWADEHAMWNDGRMDGFMTRHVATNGARFAPVTMGYYDGSPARDGSGEMDFYWSLADNFTICDNYYCSVIGGTDANRLFTMSGTIDPDAYDGGLQFLDTVTTPGPSGLYKFDLGKAGRWLPYPQVLDAHRSATGAAAPISWKVYGGPDQASTVSDNVLRYFPQFRPGTGDPQLALKAFSPSGYPGEFFADCAAGTLPQVSWVLVNAVDTEHPPASVLFGQDTTHMIVSALMSSPLWPKSALIMTYDENGGFFDHVPPPTPPPGSPGEYLDLAMLNRPANAQGKADAGMYADRPIGLGFRVPTLLISPFSRNPTPGAGPMVCSDQFDHTSTLKLLERVFGAEVPSRDPARQRPGLSPWRRDGRNIGDLSTAFNFAAPPLTGAVILAATSHVDPRTLSQCPSPALTLGTTAVDQGYPVPSTVALPVQERSPGPVLRPSGVCAAATASTPRPTQVPVVAAPGTTQVPLPNTAAEDGTLVAALALVGAAGLASAWWARRQAAVREDQPENM
ncbi:MAG: phospholipase C [Candidatus Dormibacteria bacterium]